MTLHSPKYSNLKSILRCTVARCGASKFFLISWNIFKASLV
jgi:hypothetical protein